MTRIAVIDCGTNTFNLLVADADQNGWTRLFENKLPVKLGAGGFEKKEILPSRFIRGIDAMYCHKNNIDNYDCRHIYAFATSAIREAMNANDFLETTKKLTGIDIHVINGEEEAGLIFDGIRQTIDLGSELSLVMDIGGGSVEFIIGNNNGITWKKSFLLGVSRLHDQLSPSGKMNHEEINRLRNILEQALQPLKEALQAHPCRWLIGSSGSFDTLLALYIHQEKGDEFGIGLSNEIVINAFPTLHHWLMNSTYEERLVHPSIPSIRAEYMPLASYLVKYVLELHPFQRLMHSAYSLKEGALYNILEDIDWPSIPASSQHGEIPDPVEE